MKGTRFLSLCFSIFVLAQFFHLGCGEKQSPDPGEGKAGGFEFYTTPYIQSSDGRFKQSSPGAYALGPSDSVWNVSWTVTPEHGGTLLLKSSRLVVPPGAVSETRRLTFTLATQAPMGLSNALPRVYDFGPEGTKFKVPAELKVSFSDAGLGNNDPGDYRCYHFNEEGGAWEVQPTTVDRQAGMFVAKLSHFSRYAFAR